MKTSKMINLALYVYKHGLLIEARINIKILTVYIRYALEYYGDIYLYILIMCH